MVRCRAMDSKTGPSALKARHVLVLIFLASREIGNCLAAASQPHRKISQRSVGNGIDIEAMLVADALVGDPVEIQAPRQVGFVIAGPPVLAAASASR
jgi:hypothetical protein